MGTVERSLGRYPPMPCIVRRSTRCDDWARILPVARAWSMRKHGDGFTMTVIGNDGGGDGDGDGDRGSEAAEEFRSRGEGGWWDIYRSLDDC